MKLKNVLEKMELDYFKQDNFDRLELINDEDITIGLLQAYDYDNDNEDIKSLLDESINNLSITIIYIKNMSAYKETVLHYPNESELLNSIILHD